MRRALVQSEEGAIIGGNLVSNLRFADDIGSLAESGVCTVSRLWDCT